jgi:hypothetical protein
MTLAGGGCMLPPGSAAARAAASADLRGTDASDHAPITRGDDVAILSTGGIDVHAQSSSRKGSAASDVSDVSAAGRTERGPMWRPALPPALCCSESARVVMEASQEDMTPKQILETLKKRCGSITKDESGSPRRIGVPGAVAPAAAPAAALAAAEARVAEARAAAAEGRRASMPTTLAPLAEATPLAEAEAGPPSAASRVRTARPTSSALMSAVSLDSLSSVEDMGTPSQVQNLGDSSEFGDSLVAEELP